MKKNTIIFALFIIIMNATAQDTPPIKDTTATVKHRKNEIGINTTPLISILLGSTPTVSRFSVSYKRILNDKSALRFMVGVDLSDESQKYGIDNSQNFRIIKETSDSMINQQESYSYYVCPHVNLGYEKYFGKRKLKWFYGVDLILGYNESTYTKQNINLYRDTTIGSIWVGGGVSPEMILSRKYKIFSLGLSPFIGAKYSLSKRFSVSAQISPDITYEMGHITEKDKYNNVKEDRYSIIFFNEAPGLINNISIIYKF